MLSPETPLEQTRRHVTEGQERIAKQEALIEHLAQGGEGAQTMLAQAREFLATMHGVQEQGCEHLARELAKQSAL